MVLGWLVHKFKCDTVSGRLTKVELYRYFPKSLLKKLLRHLQTKEYTYTRDARHYPRLFRIMCAREGHIYSHRWIGIKYKIHFCRVLLHDNQYYLITVYECIEPSNGSVKLEIAYLYDVKHSRGEIRGLRNPAHKLSAMLGIAKKIDDQFPIDTSRRFPDHSKGISIPDFLSWLLRHCAKKAPDVYGRIRDHKIFRFISP